jgi:adsorption protein B
MHGIALQGWDRLGWKCAPVDLWMQLRDRRGPLAAILLAMAYVLVAMSLLAWTLVGLDLVEPLRASPVLRGLLLLNLGGLLLRMVMRALYSGREYGWRVGLMAMPRLFVSNIISVMAGRRALAAYARTLRGGAVIWDKTEHFDHPVFALDREKVVA